MNICITVSGQDCVEIKNAIDTYRKAKEEHPKSDIYISFGDNLVQAGLVCDMLCEDFIPSVHYTLGVKNSYAELVFREKDK